MSGTCIPVEIEVEQDSFTADNLAVGLAFFFGFLFGLIMLLVCAKLCLKDFAKKKRQDVEEELMETQGLGRHEKHKLDYMDSRPSSRAASVRAQSAVSRKRLQSAKKRKEEEPLIPIVPVSIVENTTGHTPQPGESGEAGGSKGLVDALMRPTPAAMDLEMSEQDLDAVNSLERELKEESIMTMIQLMRTLLGQQMSKGKMSQSQYKDVMKEAQESVQEGIKQAQDEKEEQENEIKKKYAKDPKKCQEELDKLHSKYIAKMNTMMGDEKEKLRKRLTKESDLDEKEIEAILAAYAQQMARLEHKIGVERARQIAVLEERLAKRKQLTELQQTESTLQNQEADQNRENNKNMLDHLVQEGKLTDRQREELLKQYDQEVNTIQSAQEKEQMRQKLALAEKLKRNREEKMRRLKDQQERDQESFLKHSDKMGGGSEVVEGYHKLLQQQRDQREQLSSELDKVEAGEFMRIKKDEENQQQKTLEKSNEKFHEGLMGKGIDQREMDRLIRIHQQEMEEFERSKKSERKRMQQKLEEQLAKRRKKAEEEQAIAVAESQAVKDQQDVTIKKVLDNQVELSPDSREKIMKEHEQNMLSINNQLQMSKLRQKKAMEAKMAARQMKVDELKQKKEDIRRNKKNLNEKEKEKLQAQLDKQIEEEEARVQRERENALNDLRRRMAEETDAALQEQEKQMSVLIARLQVGQARRQAIITKQDKAIKELEEKLSKQVEPSQESNQQVEYLLQQHHRQVSDLNSQMQDVKGRQEHILREKLEARKLMKEREVEEKLETEAQQEWQEQKKRGALISTSILSQVMLEQRHKTEIKRLEKDMEVEMQKQREKLNDELEAELKQELEERKKSFLAQVAAISNMSKTDINELVDNVVEVTGGDQKQAKQLRKEFGEEVKRAKSQLGVEEDYGGRGGNRGYSDDRPSSRSVKPRPKSGRHYDEEDF